MKWMMAVWLVMALPMGVSGKPAAPVDWQHYHSKDGWWVDHHFLLVESQQWLTPSQVDQPAWQHEVSISVPWSAACPGRERDDHTALVIISGGDRPGAVLRESPGSLSTALALIFCRPVVEIRQVPNQPLVFSADATATPRREDSLLAWTMDRAARVGDMAPVQHAMVTAVRRSLDAVQAFSAQQPGLEPVVDFALLGSSKRGWTAWLVAAEDPRIRALVPVSIDMLNLAKQFDHQHRAYGEYTPALRAFSEQGIDCLIRTGPGKAMLATVDPYALRERLSLPKLVINASGDAYFVSDSSQFYFADMGPNRWLRYTPNSGHRQGDSLDRVVRLSQVANWLDVILEGRTPPNVSAQLENQQWVITPSEPPRSMLLWQAVNPSARDFRQQSIGNGWRATELDADGDGRYRVDLPDPDKGYQAWFVEARFGGWLAINQQVVTTDIQVRPQALPYPPRECDSHRADTDP